jgi:hypothetical protein
VSKVIGVLVLLLLLAFALPAVVAAIQSLIAPLIFITFIVGIGALMFHRRRHW